MVMATAWSSRQVPCGEAVVRGVLEAAVAYRFSRLRDLNVGDVVLRHLPRHTPTQAVRGATGFFPGEGHRRRKMSVVGGHHGECGARAYNGSLGRRASSGVQGQSLNVQRSRQI